MSDVILKGIDVSEHNGVIDWQRVKNDGNVDFVMIRAGYGQNVVDTRFHYNAKSCNDLGIPIGVYWFSYATNAIAAEREAMSCLNTIANYKIDYPVAFDFEDDSVRVCKNAGVVIKDKTFATQLALNFLGVIEKAGYVACNYMNPAYLNQYFDINKLSKYPIWLAQWPYGVPNLTKRPVQNPVIWQYSSRGKVLGILTEVDLNVSYFDYAKQKEEKEMAELSMDNLRTALKFENQKQWFEKKDDDGVSPEDMAKSLGFTDGKNPYDIPSRAEVMTMISRMAVSMQKDFDEKLHKVISDLSKSDDGK